NLYELEENDYKVENKKQVIKEIRSILNTSIAGETKWKEEIKKFIQEQKEKIMAGQIYGASNIQTPPEVSQFIFNLLKDKGKIRKKEQIIIIDPCAGQGSLLAPWEKAEYRTWSVDIDENSSANEIGDFFDTDIPEAITAYYNLILCNPPFNGYKGKLAPEIWLDKIIELFGKDIPIALFVPAGFCLNLTLKSKRLEKFDNGTYPPISSRITLPKNIFPGVGTILAPTAKTNHLPPLNEKNISTKEKKNTSENEDGLNMQETDKEKYICDGCLIAFYWLQKPEYLNSIKNLDYCCLNNCCHNQEGCGRKLTIQSIVDPATPQEPPHLLQEIQQEIKEKVLDKILLELMDKFENKNSGLNQVEILYCLIKLSGLLQTQYEAKKAHIMMKALGIYDKSKKEKVEKPANIYHKLHLIQSEVKELIRTEENKFQKYKFFNELQ
ncbi:38203_t:CDS:2, partial [Gigaspora margarita]